ncbi:riboflavin biosynthesis protein RibD [Actinomyces sp. oral taxon 448 str. F0400]|nr:riboflavin biosynthesis protein RibD [Actinomyces sp. oral taxon 448 str. F0400]
MSGALGAAVRIRRRQAGPPTVTRPKPEPAPRSSSRGAFARENRGAPVGFSHGGE